LRAVACAPVGAARLALAPGLAGSANTALTGKLGPFAVRMLTAVNPAHYGALFREVVSIRSRPVFVGEGTLRAIDVSAM